MSGESISSLSSGLHASFALEDQLSPRLDLTTSRRAALADRLCQDLHPSLLVRCAVSVKVDHLTVSKADTEAFFHKHVAFFLLSERRLASAATFCGCLFLDQR